MNLCLVHHAEAVEPHVDPQRGLSAAGRAQADGLAAQAHQAGAVPSLIWHSGKLRSRQTAEAFLRICSPFATFKMVRGLGSDDPLDWICDAIEVEDQDVLLVGHMPHVSALATRLSPGSAPLPLHGMIWLERVRERNYAEKCRLVP
jgi:phosphohistidine phosphatase